MTEKLPFKPIFGNQSLKQNQTFGSGSNRHEAALVTVTIIHLCFLPWALGGVHVWSQLTSLLLATVGFTLAALSVRRPGQPTDISAKTNPLWKRLLCWPPFWAGIFLLTYIAIQGCNPAWLFQKNETFWWLTPVRYIDWLPSGVQAPFARGNAWRSLIVFASLLLLLGSIRIGFSSKRSYRLLFWSLTINGFVLVLFGLVQRLSGTSRVFWNYQTDNHGFFATLIYSNHAGAYFNLLLTLTLGLAWWYHKNGRPGNEKSGLAGGLIFLAVFLGLAVCMSFSRASILLLFCIITGYVAFASLNNRKPTPTPARRSPLPLLFSFFVAGSLGVSLVVLNSEKLSSRFAPLATDPSAALHGRILAQKASTEMFTDRWLLGWGAESFRYAFPLYAQKYPEIYFTQKGGRQYWEHAHNDFIETFTELGVIGMIPIISLVIAGAAMFIQLRVWRNPLSLGLGLGATAMLLHGSIDFVFQCPAVLFTWAVLFLAAIRWIKLDQPCMTSSYSAIPLPPASPATSDF